jgi:hypothetical protein
MRGAFDGSAWQGLVDSLPEGYVKNDTGFAIPSVLRAQVYSDSSWVVVGASGGVQVTSGEVVMSFGGTGYAADSSGHVTESQDYRAARTLFDLLVRAKETTKAHGTLAAGVEETVTRTSANGVVECVLYRTHKGEPFQEEEYADCNFHRPFSASMTRECL